MPKVLDSTGHLKYAVTDVSDETAQDAVGGILTDSSTIDFTYNDTTPSITAIVIDSSITYAKIQNVSGTDKILGRSTAGAGVIEEITCTTYGRQLLDDASFSAMRTTLGLAIGTDVQAYAAGLTQIGALVDPDADRILFWDDSAGTYDYLTVGTGLSISSTTISATGLPGGSTTQIQYNNAGAFGGDSGFTTDGAGNLTIVGSLVVDSLTINGSGISASGGNSITLSPASGYNVQINSANLAIPTTKGIVDANGLYYTKFTATTSSVNYINITPGATGTGATIAATGSDTDVNLILSPQASGAVVATNKFTVDSITLDGAIIYGAYGNEVIGVNDLNLGNDYLLISGGGSGSVGLTAWNGTNVSITYSSLGTGGHQFTGTYLSINNGSTGPGAIRLFENTSNGFNYIGFKAPAALTGTTVFELPDGDGSNNQCIITNASAVLAWASPYLVGGTDVSVTDGGTGASDASGARTNLGLVIGTDVQAYDATLAALASFNTNGILCQTAADTFAGRTITGSGGISVTNGDGVSGAPALALSITGLTSDGSPDGAADYVVTYDASAGSNKKVLLNNLPGGGGGGGGASQAFVTGLILGLGI